MDPLLKINLMLNITLVVFSVVILILWAVAWWLSRTVKAYRKETKCLEKQLAKLKVNLRKQSWQ